MLPCLSVVGIKFSFPQLLTYEPEEDTEAAKVKHSVLIHLTSKKSKSYKEKEIVPKFKQRIFMNKQNILLCKLKLKLGGDLRRDISDDIVCNKQSIVCDKD